MGTISIFVVIIVLAFVVESIAEVVLNIIDSKFTRKNITPIIISLAVTWGYQIDLFKIISELLDIPYKLPYAGLLATALLLSRGSEWAHNFWVKFQVFLNPRDTEFELKKK